MNLQENIRRILREEVTQKYNRSNENLTKQIVIYLEKTFKNAKTKINNGGYYVSCDVCVNGDKLIASRFFFGGSWDEDDEDDETPDDQFKSGHLLISSDFVNRLSTLLRVKKSYIMNVIDDWFEDKYIQLIENDANVNGIYLTEMPSLVEPSKCVFVDIPEDITDEEMIDYVVDNTLYTKEDVVKKMESGDIDLKKLYKDKLESKEDDIINGRY